MVSQRPGPGIPYAHELPGGEGCLQQPRPRERVADRARAVVSLRLEGAVAAAPRVRLADDQVGGADHLPDRIGCGGGRERGPVEQQRRVDAAHRVGRRVDALALGRATAACRSRCCRPRQRASRLGVDRSRGGSLGRPVPGRGPLQRLLRAVPGPAHGPPMAPARAWCPPACRGRPCCLRQLRTGDRHRGAAAITTIAAITATARI